MIVAGFGFRSSATVQSLMDAIARATGERVVESIATADDKAKSAVFKAVSEQLSVPVLAISAETLVAQVTSTQSEASRTVRGTGSVAEAAALAGAGPDARLLVLRIKSADGLATCALAEGGGT